MVQWQQTRTCRNAASNSSACAGVWALDGRSVGILSWQIGQVLSRLYNIGKFRLLGSLSSKDIRHSHGLAGTCDKCDWMFRCSLVFTDVHSWSKRFNVLMCLGVIQCNKTTGYQACLAWRTVNVSDITRPPKLWFHSERAKLNVAQYFPGVLQVLQVLQLSFPRTHKHRVKCQPGVRWAWCAIKSHTRIWATLNP